MKCALCGKENHYGLVCNDCNYKQMQPWFKKQKKTKAPVFGQKAKVKKVSDY